MRGCLDTLAAAICVLMVMATFLAVIVFIGALFSML